MHLYYYYVYNDILLIVRLGEFKNVGSWKNGQTSEIVHPDYYKQILDNDNYNKIYSKNLFFLTISKLAHLLPSPR